MPVLGKVWGTTERMLGNDSVDLHLLIIKPHSQCSLHVHDRKWNAFMGVSGNLKIVVEKNNYPLVDETVIGPGEVTTVGPGEYHRFVNDTNETVVAFEMYYQDPLSDDIRRKDCGSVKPSAEGVNGHNFGITAWSTGFSQFSSTGPESTK